MLAGMLAHKMANDTDKDKVGMIHQWILYVWSYPEPIAVTKPTQN
jgi:hypothetical protein